MSHVAWAEASWIQPLFILAPEWRPPPWVTSRPSRPTDETCPLPGIPPGQQRVAEPVALGMAPKKAPQVAGRAGVEPRSLRTSPCRRTQPLLRLLPSRLRSLLRDQINEEQQRRQIASERRGGGGGRRGGMLRDSLPRSGRGLSVLEVNAGKQLPPSLPPSPPQAKKSRDSLI